MAPQSEQHPESGNHRAHATGLRHHVKDEVVGAIRELQRAEEGGRQEAGHVRPEGSVNRRIAVEQHVVSLGKPIEQREAEIVELEHPGADG